MIVGMFLLSGITLLFVVARFAGPALRSLISVHQSGLVRFGGLIVGAIVLVSFTLPFRQKKHRLRPTQARYKWVVQLEPAQRRFLERLLKTSRHLPAYQRLYAQILLQSDCRRTTPKSTRQIAADLHISAPTVVRARQRFIQQGFESLFPGMASTSGQGIRMRKHRSPHGSGVVQQHPACHPTQEPPTLAREA